MACKIEKFFYITIIIMIEAQECHLLYIKGVAYENESDVANFACVHENKKYTTML